MRSLQRAPLVITGLALAFATPLWAVVVAPPTAPVKAAQSEAVVIGKVVNVLKEPVQATVPGSTQKVAFSVAEVEVAKWLKGNGGKVDGKVIRIGSPAGKSTAVSAIKLSAGDSGLFYLNKYPSADFFVPSMAGAFVSEQNKASHVREAEETLKTLAALGDPLAALKVEDRARRLEATYFLLTAYRSVPPNTKYSLDPLPTAQSKLLLKTLLDADWDFNKYKGDNFKHNPALLFNSLGVGAKEGFQKPNQGLFSAEYRDTAKQWLSKNWDTFTLTKVVITAAR